MAILNNSNAISTAGGYDVNNSLRFRSSASAYLSRTPASAGNRTTWTWSAWVKLGTLSTNYFLFGAGSGATTYNGITFNGSSGQLQIYQNNAGTVGININTTAVLRDPSAWYHLVVTIDTTSATSTITGSSTDRVRVYINGVQQTSFTATNIPSQNYNTLVNSTSIHTTGAIYAGSYSNYFDGYMAEVNFIDGQALTPSSFGSTNATTGVWQPAKYTGTYGTNGFYLQFSDIALTSGSNAGLGKDFSGNTNYWTTNNISVTSGTTYDAMKDSPTNTSATVANYAVLNPLQSSATLSFANLQAASSTSGWKPTIASMAMTSGKWYAEFTVGFADANNGMHVGIVGENFPFASGNYIGQSSTSYGYRSYNGYKYNNGANSAYGASFTTGDVIGIALDLDAGTITFYKNNTSQGTAYTGLAGVYFFAVSFEYTTSSPSGNFNFGQRPFAYTPPSGFVALNTFNLPNSTVVKGNTVMDATLYTGNGSTQSVTNAGSFKPDFVWLKERSSTSSNNVYDSIRGTTKYLLTNATDVEGTDATSLTAFNTNGFSLGGAGFTNENTQTYVGWQWQAGQGTNTTNTNGSITSTVSVNATAGFSIVTYTGTGANATVGHGLGVVPKMIIIKSRSGVLLWPVYHASLANTEYLTLNLSSAKTTAATTVWNSTTPTSSVFSLGSATGVNTNAGTYVAYCWAEIAGFSKFGSYTGNGSTDGPFIYLGFRPKFILAKMSSGISNWYIRDTSRDTYNTAFRVLYPDTTDVEGSDTTFGFDLLSNGFKVRSSANGANQSGQTFIYAAFAENPFKNALAR